MIEAEALAKQLLQRAQTRLGGSPDVHRHGMIYVDSWERLDPLQRQAWVELAEEAMNAVKPPAPPGTTRTMGCGSCGLVFTESLGTHSQDSGICPRCTTGAAPLG